MFSFAHSRPRRRTSLTPMIDVVFLLLVFFMLAARFGQDFTVPLVTSGTGTAYEGPPRLIVLETNGVSLNGKPLDLEVLADALGPLMSAPEDAVLLQPLRDVPLQQLIDVMDALNTAGLTNVVVVPAP